ncbi:hypothetical protein [Acinetobacter baumannii]|uniref:hypothetical protein n=1 Tax=Acinetobacter baumannii TaxID=470 RepID=UPI00041F0CD9|nr:hypothetical protein [Acinetobacter baumannii]
MIKESNSEALGEEKNYQKLPNELKTEVIDLQRSLTQIDLIATIFNNKNKNMRILLMKLKSLK